MKQLIIIAATLATLASCTKNAPMEVAPVAEDEAIGFSAYAGNAATKGTSYAVEDVIATDKGIGVFAFYQPANGTAKQDFNSRKYATPDFMYNQQVTSNDGSAWTYTPVKYWPNNDGDQISFFAYAPYDKDTAWEDLGLKTDVNATKLTASFPIYTEKKAMKDYLFATPELNKSKQNIGGSTISFPFEHITSRIAIQIGAIVDKVPATTPQAWIYPNTVITVESIEIQNIAESVDYTYYIKADGTEHPAGSKAFVSSGSQNLILSAKAGDFENYLINKTTFSTGGWKNLLAKEGVSADKPGHLFIAPQDLTNANLVITYKVETTNEKNPAYKSTITNVIEKPIGVEFESGKAYTLNLLIGMKTFEISATVSDWTELDHYIENGTDYGKGIQIGDVIWAPVNCGIDAGSPYGKLYQWGRKYGQGYDGEANCPTGDNLVNLTATLTEYPDGDTYNGKFYYGQENWYKGSDAYDLWIEAGSTDYNPCPDGWRVPTVDELGNLLYTDWVPTEYSGFSSLGEWDSTKKGWYFEESGLFLPAAGVREFDGSASSRGETGAYWSSSVFKYEDEDYVIDSPLCLTFIYERDEEEGIDITEAYLIIAPRAYGLSVRCVKE